MFIHVINVYMYKPDKQTNLHLLSLFVFFSNVLHLFCYNFAIRVATPIIASGLQLSGHKKVGMVDWRLFVRSFYYVGSTEATDLKLPHPHPITSPPIQIPTMVTRII